MSKQTITIPDLSGASDVDVIEVLVKVGDRISEGDSLITLETDKASMEVPATTGGVITAMYVKEGDQVNEGDQLLELDVAEGAAAVVAEVSAAVPVNAPVEAASAPTVVASQQEKVLIPDLSGATDVDVIEVLVKVGDQIEEGDSLITLETDKASMEVPAPSFLGVITALHIKVGDQVNENDLLLEVSVAGSPVATTMPAREQGASESVVAPVSAVPAAFAPATQAALEKVLIPDLSGASDVDVIEVMVKVGDSIQEGDSLITLETDKASMEVPAPVSGVITALHIKVGDQVSENDLLLEVQTQVLAAAAPVDAPVVAPSTTPVAAAPAAVAQVPAAAPAPANLASFRKSNRQVHAGPAVRALAREFGVDLALVKGSGPKNRVLKEDVQLYVKSALKQLAETPKAAVAVGSGIPAIPAVDFSQFGEIEKVKLSKIDKLTRDNMARCWLNIPHVTQFDDADITELEAFRKEVKDEALKSGVKLTPLPFLIKAAALALTRHQKFNASLDADGEHIVYKKYVNIGLAVDTPNGLMVPVIKDADKKSVYALSIEAAELAAKAKDRKLKPNEMQGACFTISSLGGIGGKGFTPIVNAPEVAILGVSKADIQPRWNGQTFEPRLMLPLCLSYDHRAINGGDAGRFLTELNALLSDIRRLLL